MIINPRWGRQIQYDPSALLAVQSAGAITSIAGGISQSNAANQNAQIQEQQGNLALQESQINANNAAFNETQQVQNQRLAFLANGVSLEGSPSLVLAQSKQYAQTQVNSILNEGAAQYNLSQEQAAVTKNQGRAALISGLAQGVGSEATGVGEFTKAGGTFNSNLPLSGKNIPL